MAIVLKNNTYHITIDSHTIIGIMGNNYDEFLASLEGDSVFYLDKRTSVSQKVVGSLIDITDEKVINFMKDFNLENDFINRRIANLSHSELKLLKYLLLVLSNKKIIVIDEPFMDLDYQNRKKIKVLINKLIKDSKTVIIGSNNSNIIYALCKKILLIDGSNYHYDDIEVFKDNVILDKYHIMMPDIVTFVSLARTKQISLNYVHDIRDLIKDVYRNV